MDDTLYSLNARETWSSDDIEPYDPAGQGREPDDTAFANEITSDMLGAGMEAYDVWTDRVARGELPPDIAVATLCDQIFLAMGLARQVKSNG